uniref:Uncharacterized protein n=1 Tax=Caenorhabditis japonica TaxID=281687 RepID=A0A8R1EFC3_CAEJA
MSSRFHQIHKLVISPHAIPLDPCFEKTAPIILSDEFFVPFRGYAMPKFGISAHCRVSDRVDVHLVFQLCCQRFNTIPLKGKDPMVYGYLCAVDRCIHDFFEVETPNDKFELIWRKIPESMNWCATNAQMSVVKFTTRQELGMFKVNNMLEKKRGNAKCTAVVISFDEDTSLRDLDLEKLLKTCSVHHVTFSSSKIQGLANVLKSINPVIDVLIVGPSKSPSYLLFQQFLGDSYVYLPTICQVNFAYTLPRAAEEDGFNKSIRKLRAEHNFLLMGASKDRTDMHLNLFMENMDKPYCPERYFRYFSYF